MLQLLPFEILDQIVSYIPEARDIANLARTSQILDTRIQNNLWRTFARSTFPSLASVNPIIPPVDEARGLVALSRNWDRLSFFARDVSYTGIEEIRTNRNTRGQQIRRGNQTHRIGVDRQSMGYVPNIDSHEEIIGGGWNRRNDVVIWTAGPRILYRYRRRGEDLDSVTNQDVPFDQNGARSVYSSFQEPNSVAGRDDWTALQLLRPANGTFQSKDDDQTFSVVTGAASGRISVVETCINSSNLQRIQHKISQEYQGSSSSAIRGLDISPSQRFILSASASRNLDLFDTQAESERNAIPSISTLQLDPKSQCWSARYLTEEIILAGIGSSTRPLQVHHVSPTGIVPTPLRTYISPRLTSVYSLLALPPTASGSSHTNQVFLSGQRNGLIFLRDLRSPQDFETLFSDPTDDEAIYSLLTKGHERLIVGSSVNTVMKIYDLRMPDRHHYSHTFTQRPAPVYSATCPTSSNTFTGWNMFLRKNHLHTNAVNPRPYRRNNWIPHSVPSDTRSKFSPVYSLSSPSTYSPTIYAGLEGRLVEIDVVDVYDRFPDPVFNIPANVEDVKALWDPNGKALELAGYDQTSNKLMKQMVGLKKAANSPAGTGLDGRWGVSG